MIVNFTKEVQKAFNAARHYYMTDKISKMSAVVENLCYGLSYWDRKYARDFFKNKKNVYAAAGSDWSDSVDVCEIFLEELA